MLTGNPFQALLAIPDHVERIKVAIADMIDNLPQNPRITPINPRCFTVSSKNLGSNWNPFYHDFKSQAEHIQSRIMDMEPQFIIPTLKRIVLNQAEYHKGQWYRFHPMFCNHLKSLIETYGVE